MVGESFVFAHFLSCVNNLLLPVFGVKYINCYTVPVFVNPFHSFFVMKRRQFSCTPVCIFSDFIFFPVGKISMLYKQYTYSSLNILYVSIFIYFLVAATEIM